MPLTSFCNRLVVTRTRRIAPFSSSRLAPLRPPLPTQALVHACALSRTRAFRAGAGWPLPASPAPNGDAVRAASPTSNIVISPRKAVRSARGLPNINSLWLCRPSTSRVACSMALLVTLLSSSAEANPSSIARTPSWCRALPLHPSKARSAFHRQVPPLRSSPSLGALLRGPPLVPRFCHRWPSFRHAFTGL
jgi:hypothetical protein